VLRSFEHILNNYNNNICNTCNLTIHPNFIGYHKCGYANCPICKNAITNSQYWYHIRSHPGHENDSPPLPRGNLKPEENTRIMVELVLIVVVLEASSIVL
jgi:hypothetical protein